MRSISLLILFQLSIIYSAPEEDLVKNMPDDYPYKGVLYSGYLDIQKGKHLHYLFAESQSDPSTDPLVLWLNGGPGCSSLIGFTQENGPAVFRDGAGKLTVNPYSWNQKANMFYLESPSGVGFSYSDDGVYVANDFSTGKENLEGVVQFFEKFPEYIGRDFYITGESYGGVYIPFLAYDILEWNLNATEAQKINLQGILIGNGVTDLKYDIAPANRNYTYTHNLYSNEYRKLFLENCQNYFSNQCSPISHEIFLTYQNIDAYHIYKKCGKEPTTLGKRREVDLSRKYKTVMNKYFSSAQNITEYPYNCTFDVNLIYDFLNSEDVQTALNIPNPIYWEECWNGTYNSNPNASIFLYPYLLKSGIKIQHFNGDADSKVPFNGLFDWVSSLNLGIKKNWRPWRVLEDRNGGFVIEYDGITIVTIQGTGHMAAEWKPHELQHMFNSFIHGTEI